jgi:hypothetical protein
MNTQTAHASPSSSTKKSRSNIKATVVIVGKQALQLQQGSNLLIQLVDRLVSLQETCRSVARFESGANLSSLAPYHRGSVTECFPDLCPQLFGCFAMELRSLLMQIRGLLTSMGDSVAALQLASIDAYGEVDGQLFDASREHALSIENVLAVQDVTAFYAE